MEWHLWCGSKAEQRYTHGWMLVRTTAARHVKSATQQHSNTCMHIFFCRQYRQRLTIHTWLKIKQHGAHKLLRRHRCSGVRQRGSSGRVIFTAMHLQHTIHGDIGSGGQQQPKKHANMLGGGRGYSSQKWLLRSSIRGCRAIYSPSAVKKYVAWEKVLSSPCATLLSVLDVQPYSHNCRQRRRSSSLRGGWILSCLSALQGLR